MSNNPHAEPTATPTGFATIRQAEDYLQLCRAKLYLLMDQGELTYAKMGRSRRIPWRALHEYAEKCMVGR